MFKKLHVNDLKFKNVNILGKLQYHRSQVFKYLLSYKGLRNKIDKSKQMMQIIVLKILQMKKLQNFIFPLSIS